MSSFRNYSDAGAYRTRTGIGSGGGGSSTFGRNASTGSSFSNYRNNYTGIGSTSIKPPTMKERNIATSYVKSMEKERSTPSRLSNNGDSRPASRCSSRASTSSYLDKYSLSSGANSYNEPNRNDKKDKELLSYRGLRTNTEPSPEIKINAYKVTYSRTPTFGKSNNSSNISESSSPSLSTRYGGSTTNSRYSTTPRSNPERVTTSMGYTGTEKFRSPLAKPAQPKDIPKCQNCEGCVDAEVQTPATESKDEKINNQDCDKKDEEDDDIIVITVVTRGTSPTPPPSLTAYTRTRRLEPIPKPVQRKFRKSEINRIIVQEQEQQVDIDTSRDRYSRYGGNTGRIPWVSSYLGKFNGNTSPSPTPYSSRTGYISSPKATNNYGYTRSNETASTSKDNSTRSTSSSASCSHEPQEHHSRSSSISTPVSVASSRGRVSPKVDSGQKKRASEEDRSSASRDDSTRVVEGHDHGHGPGSRRGDSSSRSTDNSSSSQSKPGHISRSGSLKSRHVTSPETSSVVSVPTGSTSIGSSCNSSRSASNKLALSTSSSAAATAAVAMTKIKSAGATTTTTTGNSSTSSSSSNSSHSSGLPTSSVKCAIHSAGSSVGSRQATPPDARDRKPPVPKTEMAGKIVSTTSSGGGTGIKYVNKDFRKSALNMENGDPSRSQASERKPHKKCQRSMSASSQDSQSEADVNQSPHQLPSSGSSASLRSIKSGSKSRTPSLSKSSSVSRVEQKSSESRKSDSKSPVSLSLKNGRASRQVSASTSDCSSHGSSSESSASDEEEGEEGRSEKGAKSEVGRRRASSSPFQGKMSAGSSKTSVLASSADELSANNTDKPPRPPSSPRSRSDKSGKSEEAKSFIMRALAPVTSLFKPKENGADIRNGGWVETGSEDNSDSGRVSKRSTPKSSTPSPPKSIVGSASPEKISTEENKWTGLRHQSSGEKPWWLDPNSDNVPDGVERNPSVGNDDISQDTTVSINLPDDGKFKFKVWRQDSEERAWWLDDNDNNIPDEDMGIASCIQTNNSNNTSSGVAVLEPTVSVSRRGSCRSGGSSPHLSRSERAARLRRQQSGERAWWMSDDPDGVPEGIEVIPVTPASSASQDGSSEPDKSDVPIGRRIRRIESGERPAWLDSSPEQSGNENQVSPAPGQPSKFPVDDEPLGDRASPEGIENPPDPPDSYEGRSSPYDNVTNSCQTPPRRTAPRKRPANLPLFIGTHKNIDDLLGDETDLSHSPDRSSSKKQQYSADLSDSEGEEEEEEEECEEIDAAQVIIHDSTPQTPVIQRRHRDIERPQPDGYIPTGK